jgi:non-specific serine/threonine protein kinase
MGTAMREFAVEQLAATGEEAAVRLRHAEYYAALARANEPLLRGPRQHELMVRLSREWPNLRSAAEWALDNDQLPLAASIYADTWLLAWQGNYVLDSESFTDRMRENLDRLDERLRARVLFVGAGMYVEMGQAHRALPLARPAADLAVEIGDRLTEAWSRIAIAAAVLGDDVADPEARRQVEASVAVARAIDDPMTLSYAVSFQGTLAILDGDLEAAFACHRESLELARRLDHSPVMVQAFSQIAIAHLVSGDPIAARTCLEVGVEFLDQVRSVEALALFLDSVAWLAFAENDRVRALTALGAADTVRQRAGLVRWVTLEALLEEAGMAAESEQPELVQARRAGSAMTPIEASVYGLRRHHDVPGPPEAPAEE